MRLLIQRKESRAGGGPRGWHTVFVLDDVETRRAWRPRYRVRVSKRD